MSGENLATSFLFRRNSVCLRTLESHRKMLKRKDGNIGRKELRKGVGGEKKCKEEGKMGRNNKEKRDKKLYETSIDLGILSNPRIIYFKGTLDVRVWNTHNKKIHFHCYFFNIKDALLSVLCVK